MTAIQTQLRGSNKVAAAPVFDQTAGPLWGFLFAMLTLGIGPAFFWAGRWARFVADDRRFWFDVIAAVRPGAATHADASLLDDLSRRLSRPLLAPMVCRVGVIGLACGLLAAMPDVGSISDLWRVYFGSRRYVNFYDRNQVNAARVLWQTGLITLFVIQWYAVRSYAVNVHELVKWANRRAKKSGIPQVKNQALRSGFFPLWLIVTIFCCCCHAWWAIPMAMTGALARRYTTRSGGDLRAGITRQLDAAGAFPSVVGPDVRYCPGPGCGKRLPGVAKFCPRCGQLAPGVLARGSAA